MNGGWKLLTMENNEKKKGNTTGDRDSEMGGRRQTVTRLKCSILQLDLCYKGGGDMSKKAHNWPVPRMEPQKAGRLKIRRLRDGEEKRGLTKVPLLEGEKKVFTTQGEDAKV